SIPQYEILCPILYAEAASLVTRGRILPCRSPLRSSLSNCTARSGPKSRSSACSADREALRAIYLDARRRRCTQSCAPGTRPRPGRQDRSSLLPPHLLARGDSSCGLLVSGGTESSHGLSERQDGDADKGCSAAGQGSARLHHRCPAGTAKGAKYPRHRGSSRSQLIAYGGERADQSGNLRRGA